MRGDRYELNAAHDTRIMWLLGYLQVSTVRESRGAFLPPPGGVTDLPSVTLNFSQLRSLPPLPATQESSPFHPTDPNSPKASWQNHRDRPPLPQRTTCLTLRCQRSSRFRRSRLRVHACHRDRRPRALRRPRPSSAHLPLRVDAHGWDSRRRSPLRPSVSVATVTRQPSAPPHASS